ncbi:YrdB family protein [Amycolatopsis sp. NPDC102389]|uniref:YrdB family protein n=1 Tax=Amycolatopsis sp. NPDC102389 TaxID=3363941 RepID=UPI0037F6AF6B
MREQPSEPLHGVRGAALIVRFLLELALLTGAAVLAWRLGPEGWRWAAMILAPVAVAVFWGFFLAEKARVVLAEPVRLVLETALFLSVGAGLIAGGPAWPAVIGVALWAADRLVLAVTRGKSPAPLR